MQEFNGMRVGDLITTYHKGYWILEKIESRQYYNPLFYYRKIANENFRFVKSNIISSCDALYCAKVIEFNLIKIKNEFNTRIDTFIEFINNYYKNNGSK